ncbi:hypothetical protein ACTHQ4_10510 [Alkalicoccobacillus gibsonii]|uniref:hypothetical protein n=1 Tax=Alkalicoccobacillus gibsonii TaxID=79881 RepID=UPI003F7C0549
MAKSNRECVQCHTEVPFHKLFFKGLANRMVTCPECREVQQVGIRVLLFKYLVFVVAIINMMISINFVQHPLASILSLILLLSCFIFEPFKKLEPLKEKQPH